MLATGGTTGAPKLVLHDLAVLLAAIPLRTGRACRMMPLMRFDHIGGLDMAWRALAGGQILVGPPPVLSPEAVAARVARHAVQVLPATPSFLNLLLLAGLDLEGQFSALKVVPYGAEPMPEGLLKRLRAALPSVEFVQRFGTSETGTLPVRDCGSGLVLDASKPGFEWKIVAGELWVRSPSRGLGYLSGGDNARFADNGWFETGDLAVALSDGSVRILGRRAELINVGGEKVLPSSVEAVLLAHPLMIDCRVRAGANALLGEVVAVDVVWREKDDDLLTIKRSLRDFATSLLPKSHLPTVVRRVAVIETTSNFKKNRSNNK